MMRRNRLGVLVLVTSLAGWGAACGGDDDDDTNNGGTGSEAGTGAEAGKGEAGSGEAGSGVECMAEVAPPDGECINDGEVNADCPPIGPQIGSCAPKGACCHRSSNKVKETMTCNDDPLVLEYRLNFSLTKNHETTIGAPLLVSSGTGRYDREQQSILWRFKMPRQDGEIIAGEGETTIGVGRYNCDGTYSYYSDTAAPVIEGISDDVSRWKPRTVKSQIDPAKTGRDRMTINFADNLPGRGLVYTPFLLDDGSAMDWELINEGYDIQVIDTDGEGRDCIGSRDGNKWTPGGTFVVWTPLPENDKENITLIMQTYCQLVAFGILPADMRTTLTCEGTPRCMPDGGMLGDGGCDWAKLPDGLCPSDDAERALYGCHLGAKGNPNAEVGYPSDAELNCSDDAPTSPADPATGTAGQCCDPLGDADPENTLPACNAYRLIQDYVAAAAEINDEFANEVQAPCMMP